MKKDGFSLVVVLFNSPQMNTNRTAFYGITSERIAKWIETIFCTTWYKLFAINVTCVCALFLLPFTNTFLCEIKWNFTLMIGLKNGLHSFKRPICFVREFFPHFFLSVHLFANHGLVGCSTIFISHLCLDLYISHCTTFILPFICRWQCFLTLACPLICKNCQNFFSI